MSYLQCFCVKQSKLEDVCFSLATFNNEIDGIFRATEDSDDKDNILKLFPLNSGNVFVELGESHYSADKYLEYISMKLARPVIYFLMGSDELWFYELFVNGAKIDTMYSNLNVGLTDEERRIGKGSPGILAKYWNCDRRTIENYYRNRGDLGKSELERKAYPEDKYEYWNEWQMTDFMNKLDIHYPYSENGVSLIFESYFMNNKYSQLEDYEEIIKKAWDEAFNEDLPDDW